MPRLFYVIVFSLPVLLLGASAWDVFTDPLAEGAPLVSMAQAQDDPPDTNGGEAQGGAGGQGQGKADGQGGGGEDDKGDNIYAESLTALTKLFVLAILIESALSVIFNWRVFLTYFSLRGVRTIIMIAVSYFVVAVFNIDIVAELINVYQPDEAHTRGNLPTEFITALILAGGSAGVHNIMRGLGYRSGAREEEVAPQPPRNEAWIAVWATRKEAVGEIFVTVRQVTVRGAGPAPIAGVIGARRPSLRELLLRNFDRFPQNGGYTVEPDKVYEITVEGKNKEGERLAPIDGEKFSFARGAIVDFDVTI